MQEIDAHTTTGSLREIEDIALELDKAIEVSHIDHRKLAELRVRYQKSTGVLSQGTQKNDSRFYIIDEVAGLFSWIEGNKKVATDHVASAVARKGDTQLTSQAARGLAATLKTSATYPVAKDSRSAIHGWLGFFHIVISLVAALSLVISVLGTIGTVLYPSSDITSWVALILFWTISIISISYLVFALRESHKAIPLAITLFLILTLFSIVLLISAIMAESYDDAAGLKELTVTVLLFLIACGISTAVYYARSLKVRQVFNR